MWPYFWLNACLKLANLSFLSQVSFSLKIYKYFLGALLYPNLEILENCTGVTRLKYPPKKLQGKKYLKKPKTLENGK